MTSLRSHWTLEEGLAFLNHGSFGACPRTVLQEQDRLRGLMEQQPVSFFVRELEGLFDAARQRLASFLGARPENLAAVTNATAGVNSVLRSLVLRPGDELLTTDHAYNACRNTLDFVAARAGARVIVCKIPLPLKGPNEVLDRILDAASSKTRLALIDHITSPTGIVLPVEDLVRELSARGIDTLVDGAHGPGMVKLELESLGAAYYTGNCHKWLCAPKGAAFLHVRPDRQEGIVPLSVSHGANMPRPGRGRFHDLFDWTGTDDPTPFLCVPAALDALDAMVPGGWPEIQGRNRELALEARRILSSALEEEPFCPEEMIGSLAAVPLPDRPLVGGRVEKPTSALYRDPLQETLLRDHRIEVPIVPWPKPPKRLVRVSAQLYNEEGEYQRLAKALGSIL